MSFTQDVKSLNAINGDVVSEEILFPFSELESNEPPLETYLHLQQMLLLIKCLDWWWRERNDYFATGNLTIYYSPKQRKSEDFRGPDFFVVLDTERKPRKSWVVWEEEGKYPNVIVELLSSSTTKTDKGLKKQIYQDTFRTPEYFWLDPESLEFEGFALIRGTYEKMQPNEEGLLWSGQLGLYLGVHEEKLRFFTDKRELIPTPEEVAIAQQQRAEQAETLLAQYRERFGELPEE